MYETFNVLTSRDVHIAMKKEDGIQYLMDRFGFETSDILFQTIRKVTPSNADAFIKSLKKKQKKSTRFEGNSEELKIDSKEGRTESFGELFTNQPFTDNVTVVVKDNDSLDSGLESFYLQEDELSNMLRDLEVKHKEQVSKRRDIVSQLSTEKGVLERVREVVKKHEEKITELCKEYEDCKVVMEEFNTEIRECREYLNEVRKNIALLKRPTIFMYNTGLIEVENTQSQPISEDSLNEEFVKLISCSKAECFTIKQLKSIAKLGIMMGMYDNPEEIELVFEDSSIHQFYEEVYCAK